jgi:excisionase family DNA binding protein
VREHRQGHNQRTGAGTPRDGEFSRRSTAAAQRIQPDIAAVQGNALSRPTTGHLAADADAEVAAEGHSSRLGLDAAAESDPRRAYTINDSAKILSISRSTVYKLVNLGSLKAIKLCGRTLITRASIDDLLAGDQ